MAEKRALAWQRKRAPNMAEKGREKQLLAWQIYICICVFIFVAGASVQKISAIKYGG